jgi:serine phosphatase RsbU (regulator of sigma subunit)
VLVSLTWAQPQRYNISKLLTSTPVYILLTICLTFIYYGAITVVQLFLYQSPAFPLIIPVTSTLAFAIIFEPVREYIQKRIERRFNLREREKAIEAFTATLREEIDLDQLRERFLMVIQKIMQPYSVSFWIRTIHSEPEPSGSTEEIMVADDDPLIAYVLRHPGTLGIDRLHLDSPALQKLSLRAAELLLPLASQGELLGLLVLGPHLRGAAYSREERALLDTLAPQIAPTLRVAQLVQAQQAQVREHERIEQELRMAQDIQQAFLSKDPPTLPGWQITPYYQPAREVGGDFYDFLPFADGRLGIVIGDVSGKGVPAALLMATVHTMLRTAVQGMSAPGEILARVNNLLYAETPSGMFVTCFYALLDPKSGRLRYANAGQDLPYRLHKDGVSELWATGMPLGMMPSTRYEEHDVNIAPGDSLLFYSDGLVEAHNSRHEMFDTPRLKALLETHAGGASLIDVLLSELTRFTGEGSKQEDDVTLLMLQSTPASLAMSEEQARPYLLCETTMANTPGNEKQAMEWVAEVVRLLHLPLNRLVNLKTAVAEAVMNSMEHGNQFQPDKPVLL